MRKLFFRYGGKESLSYCVICFRDFKRKNWLLELQPKLCSHISCFTRVMNNELKDEIPHLNVSMSIIKLANIKENTFKRKLKELYKKHGGEIFMETL